MLVSQAMSMVIIMKIKLEIQKILMVHNNKNKIIQRLLNIFKNIIISIYLQMEIYIK
jgi:hypothetical protein